MPVVAAGAGGFYFAQTSINANPSSNSEQMVLRNQKVVHAKDDAGSGEIHGVLERKIGKQQYRLA